jgi:K+-sensing histidine kinase KdpD
MARKRKPEAPIDEIERGRTTLLRLEAFLGARSRGFVLVVGLLLLALVALIDGEIGRLDLTLFYLVPVAVVTFTRGRWMGLLFAGVASIAGAAVQVVNHVTRIDSPVTYLNALTKFYAFALVALLVWPMRAALLYERRSAEQEADAADELRALLELREAAERAAWEMPAGQDPVVDELREALKALDEVRTAGEQAS